GAPCGSTWHIAEKLIGSVIEPRETLWERIAKAHHTYPCLASMEMDQELGDTILHKAQYLIRGAVEDSLR
ncbi:MAG: thymidylate synthase, partial [Thermoprotei archaeon]